MTSFRFERRNWWRLWRYDMLVNEGFTPEEASLISHVRISAGPVRRLRRQRRMAVQRAVNAGLTRQEAVELIRAEVRNNQAEILTWTQLRQVLYPQRNNLIEGLGPVI